jgi:glucan biosynthesis protein C
MTRNTVNTDRLHALDNLRAVMMWLGIVLHVGVIYTVYPLPLPLPSHDLNTSLFADWLVALIHCFRMPVFFILAGFFLVLLAQRRGVKGMLTNRLKRLSLPFLLLWPPIFVLMILMILLFAHRAAHGTWGIDLALVPNIRNAHPLDNTMHLWFLWMLSWFALVSALLAPVAARVPAGLRRQLSSVFARVAGSPWGFVVLAIPLALVGATYKEGFVTASGHFLAPLMEWLHNALFFAFGLALYAHRSRLFALYQQRWRTNTVAGLGLFSAIMLVKLFERERIVVFSDAAFWTALAFNACTWLWSFSLIGLFLRFLGRQHPVLDYLAQSSYWVYVIHMPLTIGMGACLYSLDIPALVKMPINIGLTTVLALLSYHLFVRSTALGGLLNGRRHPFTFFGWRLTGARQVA